MEEKFSFGSEFEFSEGEKRRIEYLFQIEKAGVAERAGTLGYMPLTILELETMAKTGLYAGAKEPNDFKSAIYYPSVSRAKANYTGRQVKDFQPIEEAEEWAKIEAAQQAFLEKLGGVNAVRNENFGWLGRNIIDQASPGHWSFDQAQDFFAEKFELKPQQVDDYVREAKEFKGFTAALSVKALEKFTTDTNSEDDLYDIEIYAPGGIPLENFIGLKAQGPKERAYLEALKEKLK